MRLSAAPEETPRSRLAHHLRSGIEVIPRERGRGGLIFESRHRAYRNHLAALRYEPSTVAISVRRLAELLISLHKNRIGPSEKIEIVHILRAHVEFKCREDIGGRKAHFLGLFAIDVCINTGGSSVVRACRPRRKTESFLAAATSLLVASASACGPSSARSSSIILNPPADPSPFTAGGFTTRMLAPLKPANFLRKRRHHGCGIDSLEVLSIKRRQRRENGADVWSDGVRRHIKSGDRRGVAASTSGEHYFVDPAYHLIRSLQAGPGR